MHDKPVMLTRAGTSSHQSPYLDPTRRSARAAATPHCGRDTHAACGYRAHARHPAAACASADWRVNGDTGAGRPLRARSGPWAEVPEAGWGRVGGWRAVTGDSWPRPPRARRRSRARAGPRRREVSATGPPPPPLLGPARRTKARSARSTAARPGPADLEAPRCGTRLGARRAA